MAGRRVDDGGADCEAEREQDGEKQRAADGALSAPPGVTHQGGVSAGLFEGRTLVVCEAILNKLKRRRRRRTRVKTEEGAERRAADERSARSAQRGRPTRAESERPQARGSSRVPQSSGRDVLFAADTTSYWQISFRRPHAAHAPLPVVAWEAGSGGLGRRRCISCWVRFISAGSPPRLAHAPSRRRPSAQAPPAYIPHQPRCLPKSSRSSVPRSTGSPASQSPTTTPLRRRRLIGRGSRGSSR